MDLMAAGGTFFGLLAGGGEYPIRSPRLNANEEHP